MKIMYKTNDGRLTAEIEGDKQTDVFSGLASFQEVFEHNTCGKCKKSNVRFVVRKNKDDDEFFEIHCSEAGCRARLAFGQHKKGGSLFPSKKDKEGNWLPDNGWVKYNAATQKEE